jgi:protein-glutamine gamma-glutamyltransferase
VKTGARLASRRSAVSVAPNRNTVGLGAVLLAMLYAGMGQNNGSAYLLCFLVASLAAVSMLHAWANLRGVAVEAGPLRAVFAGEELVAPVRITASNGRRHAALAVVADGAKPARLAEEVTLDSPGTAALQIPALSRGCFHHLDLTIESLFPLGFFTARSSFNTPVNYYVYPRPDGNLPLPVAFDPARRAAVKARTEGDDFAGVREWQAGESMRHVDWKAAARGHWLLVKQWRGATAAESLFLILDWAQLERLAPEDRLSQLARWVLLAEHHGATYGLRLPGQAIAPARGDVHMHACLRALASFDAGCAADPPEGSA